ncbi:RipA family octameric membrane protein [Cellulomonas sp. ICMP 17802]|uniref:RipA family octameric membrane protein n=1 Tax=Cellulomonas sp. ICMP 17802 TaxID=3239199 RepID=UPI00351B297B
MDLYKLAVEMADRVSARRGVANSFFVALQSAILSSLGFLSARAADPWILVAVCLSGAVTSATWFLLLRSYRTLNRAKFTVITRLETELAHQIFAEEWTALRSDPIQHWRARYAELGTVERVVPVVFLVINVVLAVNLASS